MVVRVKVTQRATEIKRRYTEIFYKIEKITQRTTKLNNRYTEKIILCEPLDTL